MANFFTPKKRDNLSPLQCCILTLGKKNGGIVLARDVLIEYYGFKPVRDPSCLNAGAIVFRKADIGIGRYNAATVAVCKAFNRLVERGVAIRIFSGIRLKAGMVSG
jgi:hypothetical protein